MGRSARNANSVNRLDAQEFNSLVDLATAEFVAGQKYQNFGFYPDTGVGGGVWKAVSGLDKSTNNGGTVVTVEALQAWYDAAVAAGGVTTDNLQANLSTLFAAGAGTGDGFVRTNYTLLSDFCFGCQRGPGFDNLKPMQMAIDVAAAEGVELVSPDGDIYLSGQTLSNSPLSAAENLNWTLSSSARLVQIPSTALSLYLFDVRTVNNLTVTRFRAWGDNGELTSGGSTCTGLTLRSGRNIKFLEYCISENFRGDGIAVRDPEEVEIHNGQFNKNTRLGGAMISGKDITWYNPRFKDNGGWGDAPEMGLDIEPNSSTERLENIRIIDPITRNNVEAGINLNLRDFGGVNKTVTIDIIRHKDYGSSHGFATYDCQPSSAIHDGLINIVDPEYYNNVKQGIACRYYGAYGTTRIEIHKPKVVNPNEIGSTSTTYGSGIHIFNDVNTTTSGNIHIFEPWVEDNRETKKVVRGIRIGHTIVGGIMDNISIINPKRIDCLEDYREIDTTRIGGVVIKDENGVCRHIEKPTVFYDRGFSSYIENINNIVYDATIGTFNWPIGSEFEIVYSGGGSGYTDLAPPAGGIIYPNGAVDQKLRIDVRYGRAKFKKISETELRILSKSDGVDFVP